MSRLPSVVRHALAADRDGAVLEAASRCDGLTRRALLAATLAGTSTALLAPLLDPATTSAAAAETASDEAILNFALTLEYLQAAFYTEAERAGALTGALARQAQVVGAHERAHVTALRQVLGRAAVGRPSFDFRGQTEDPKAFRDAAVAFEDLSVAAYKDQLPRISEPKYLATALALHSVEARHAAWIRRLAGVVPAPDAFDDPIDRGHTEKLVASTRFIVSRPRTSQSRRAPRFTG
jgi:hypothetical protein